MGKLFVYLGGVWIVLAFLIGITILSFPPRIKTSEYPEKSIKSASIKEPPPSPIERVQTKVSIANTEGAEGAVKTRVNVSNPFEY